MKTHSYLPLADVAVPVGMEIWQRFIAFPESLTQSGSVSSAGQNSVLAILRSVLPGALSLRGCISLAEQCCT